MTSRGLERAWICTGGYGRFMGEWVKHINVQCGRNTNHTLLLKMSVVSEQMAMLWFYFIITMV